MDRFLVGAGFDRPEALEEGRMDRMDRMKDVCIEMAGDKCRATEA